jgi:hypothetical protein
MVLAVRRARKAQLVTGRLRAAPNVRRASQHPNQAPRSVPTATQGHISLIPGRPAASTARQVRWPWATKPPARSVHLAATRRRRALAPRAYARPAPADTGALETPTKSPAGLASFLMADTQPSTHRTMRATTIHPSMRSSRTKPVRRRVSSAKLVCIHKRSRPEASGSRLRTTGCATSVILGMSVLVAQTNSSAPLASMHQEIPQHASLVQPVSTLWRVLQCAPRAQLGITALENS